MAPQTSHATPNRINYQVSLTDSGGTPVTDPSVSMTFRIYDAATLGTLLWEESRTVSVAGGIYNVLLGSETTTTGSFDSALFSTDDLWLEVEVNAEVLTPRQQVTSVAFALQTQNADTVDGQHASDFLDIGTYDSNSDAIVDRAESADTVTIPFDVTGSNTQAIIKGTNTGSSYGVFGTSANNSGVFGSTSNNVSAGVQGINAGLGYGVRGDSDGIGVFGGSKSATGYGVYGVSDGYGVYGKSDVNYAGYFQGNTHVTGNLNVDGKVVIGIAAPAQKLSVFGVIESTGGGFKFPDGTVQTTSLNAHAANPSAHHSKTIDASELTSGLLPNARIADSAIDTAKIADGAVTNAKIVDGAVSSAKIALGSVGTAQIAAGAVSTAKLAPNFIQDLLGLEVFNTTVTVGSNGGGFTSAAPNITCSAGKTAIACGYSTEQNLWHVEAALPVQNKYNFAFTTCVYIQGGGFVCPFGQESVYLTATCVNYLAF